MPFLIYSLLVRRRTEHLFGICVGILFCHNNLASAGLIFSNGSPTLTPFSPEITVAEVAAKFSISSQATITSIDFWSYELDAPFQGYAGSIGWNIYSSDSNTGAPSSPVIGGGWVNPTRQLMGSFSFANFSGLTYQNSFSIGSSQLAPGNYLLGLKNGPPTLTIFGGFLWAESNAIAGLQKVAFTKNGSNWDNAGLSLAFQLNGNTVAPVDEPSTMALMAGGLLVVVVGVGRAGRRSRGLKS